MNFIEKWFGIAPDGGDGTLEVSLLVSVAAATRQSSYFFPPDRVNKLLAGSIGPIRTA